MRDAEEDLPPGRNTAPAREPDSVKLTRLSTPSGSNLPSEIRKATVRARMIMATAETRAGSSAPLFLFLFAAAPAAKAAMKLSAELVYARAVSPGFRACTSADAATSAAAPTRNHAAKADRINAPLCNSSLFLIKNHLRFNRMVYPINTEVKKFNYFFFLVLAALASASAASILAVVEMPHFLIWMRTLSSPVSKVTVSSVI